MAPLNEVLYFNQLNHGHYTYKILQEVIETIPIGNYFRKNSFLVEVFNDQLSALMSAGLVSYWTDKFFRPPYLRAKETNSGPKQMTLETLFGAFQLIVMGLLISFSVFLIELTCKVLKKSKKVKNFLRTVSRFSFTHSESLVPLIFFLFFKKTREKVFEFMRKIKLRSSNSM